MDELQQRLNSVLSDPGAMAQLQELASSLMGGGDSAAPVPGGAEAAAAMLGPALRGLGGKEHPLSAALGPYLSETRRQRLRRALSTASAARLAGAVLREDAGGRHEL